MFPRRAILVTPLLVAALVVCATAVADESHYLFGEIGKLPVFAFAQRNGSEISGWWVDLRHGTTKLFEGRAEGVDAFHFGDANGAKASGLFEGRIQRGQWTGEWRDANSRSPLPFTLREEGGAPAALEGSYDCSTRRTDKQFGYAYTHSLSLRIANGAVRALVVARNVTGPNGDDQSCSIALTSLKPAETDAGLLLKTEDAAGEGPRCTVRILGDDKFLYVKMGGLEGAADDDCRATSDEMFCSPRAFWADMIVNRATKRCLSVE